MATSPNVYGGGGGGGGPAVNSLPTGVTRVTMLKPPYHAIHCGGVDSMCPYSGTSTKGD